MAETSVFDVDAVGDPEPVIVKSDCEEITVYEDGQGGTSAYKVHVPFKGSSPVTKPANSKYIFRKGSSGYIKGSIAGYVEMVSGTATFAQEES